MNVESLIVSFTARGIRLIPDGHRLIAKPASKLTDADREAIRTHKALLAAPERRLRPTPAIRSSAISFARKSKPLRPKPAPPVGPPSYCGMVAFGIARAAWPPFSIIRTK